MSSSQYLLQLRQKFDPQDWPLVIIALKQDPLVWSSLVDTSLGLRAIETLQPSPDRWTPAALALLGMDEFQLDEDPSSVFSRTLADPEREKIAQVYSDWSQKNETAITLSQAGMLALYFRERSAEDGSWDSLLEVVNAGEKDMATILACLYGMVIYQTGLLRALLSQVETLRSSKLAIHAVLSNPFPQKMQAAALGDLLVHISNEEGLTVLHDLESQRPWLAVELARGYLTNRMEAVNSRLAQFSEESTTPVNGPQLMLRLDRITDLLHVADLRRLAAQPDQSMPLLAESIRATRRLQGHLSAQMAQLIAQIGNGFNSKDKRSGESADLSAWKTATQLVVDAPQYTAGLAGAMINAGRAQEARILLAAHQRVQDQSQSEPDPRPAVLLASARAAQDLGEPDRALHAASATLEQLLDGGELDNPDYIGLTQLFLKSGQPVEALLSARIGLKTAPFNRELLELQTRAGLAANSTPGALSSALSSALMALAVDEITKDGDNDQANDLEIRNLLVDSLEAAGAWETALDERKALLSDVDQPSGEDLRALAYCTLQAGQAAKAVKICKNLLKSDPQDSQAYCILGQAVLASGKPTVALEHFQKAVRLQPSGVQAWLLLAQTYQQIGDDIRALDTLRAASQAAPDHPEVHLALGEVYLEQKSLTQARTSLQKAESLGTTPRIALRLGQTLHQLGHLEEAKDLLQKTYETVQESNTLVDRQGVKELPPYGIEVVHAYAQTLLALDEWAAAMPLLEELVQLQMDDPAPRLDLAKALLRAEDLSETRRAIPLFQEVLDGDINNSTGAKSGSAQDMSKLQAEAMALLAESFAAVGEQQNAMRAYHKALDTHLAKEIGWRTRLSLGLGKAALQLDQPETALAVLLEAAQVEPNSSQIWKALAETYLASGLYQDAFQTAQKARDQKPKDPETLIWFAEQAAQVDGQPGANGLLVREEAGKALQSAVRLAPPRGDLLIRLGKLLHKSGDKPGALDIFRDLVSADDGARISPSDLRDIAGILQDMGEAQLSVFVLQRALEQDRVRDDLDNSGGRVTRVDLLDALARAHRYTGDLDAALETQAQAIALDPDRKESYLHQADLFKELDKTEQAMESLQRVLNLDPGDERVHRRMAQILFSSGDLPTALIHAERAILSADASGNASTGQAARTLAAELSYAMLRPQQAWSYLTENAPKADLQQNAYDWIALQAELALDADDEPMALEAITQMRRMAPEHPRSLAARARLSRMRGDRAAGQKLLKRAFEGLEIGSDWRDRVPSEARQRGAESLRALGQAARDLSKFEEAVVVFSWALGCGPDTPLLELDLVKSMVQAAERQRLCQALEVIEHSPGHDVLSERAYRSFDRAMRAVEQQLEEIQRWTHEGGVRWWDEGASDTFAAWGDEAAQSVNRWRARGQVAYLPEENSIKALEDVLGVIPPEANDIAAYIMALLVIGERSRAVEAAQNEWIPFAGETALVEHPLVLTYQALALSEEKPGEALDVANRALIKVTEHDCGVCLQESMLQYLVARMAYYDYTFGLAKQSIEGALDTWSDEPRWHALAARIYLALDESSGLPDSAQALFHLEQAASLEVHYAPHHLALGYAYLDNGDWKKAVEALEEATRVEEDLPDAWLGLARAQKAAGDLDRAAASADRAIKLAPDSTEPLLLHGEIALQSKNPRSALSWAQAALRIQTRQPEALRLLVRAMSDLDRPKEALAVLEKAIPLFDDSLPMQMERALLVRRSQGLEAAMPALEALVQEYPHQADILALWTEWLLDAGQVEQAIQGAQRALQVDKGDLPGEKRADLHLLVGRQMSHAGQLDQAVHHLSEMIRYPNNRLEGYLELGQVHQKRRQHDQALAIYQRAMEVAPRDYRPYFHAGKALKDVKDYLEAEDMLRRAAKLAPKEVCVHRLLAGVVALNLVHNPRLASSNG